MALSDTKLKELVAKLRGTTINPNGWITEADWLGLESLGIFKCDDCRKWLPTADRVADDIDQCKGCSK